MYTNIKAALLTVLFAVINCSLVFSSSHREAPLISNDPLADNVDLYAFRSPDDPNMITVIATYVPMQLPHGGPNYFSFGENIRYEIHVDNDASIAGDEITYRFTFNQTNEDPSTFFNIRLGKQNLKTTYTLEKSIDGGLSFVPIILNGIVPPNNIGTRSIESAVGLNTTYETLFNDAVTTSLTGEKVYAGPTDDPFFVDLAGIFDLGDAPRQAGKATDGLACMNVSAIALQIPISNLLKLGAPLQPTSILDSDYVVGLWASASRPALTTLSSTSDPSYSGNWVQVSRLGMPLTNEAVIPVGSKDYWNSITPYEELAETTMDEFFYNPELALYMDDDQFGGAVPGFSQLRIQKASLGAFNFSNGANGLYDLKGDPALDGTALDDAVFGTLLLPEAGKPRSVDLWPTFHTGVPNVIPYQLATGKGGNPLAAGKPFINNFLPNGGDMLRLNMAVPPTPRDDPFFSSLGLIQAAAIGLTVAPYNETTNIEFIPNMDGFPNGRRLEDDVTRIELQAVAGVVLAAVGLWYDDYDPMTSASPVTTDLVNVLSYTTGVENNDVAFSESFPYLAMPHSGTGSCSGQIYNGDPKDDAITNAQFFVSSNTQKTIGLFDINEDQELSFTQFVAKANDADGIHYDEVNDILYQLNRTENVIDIYTDVLKNLDLGIPPSYVTSSSSDFINGRELTVSGNKLVVAQDAADANGQVNSFVIYTIDGTAIQFNKSYTSDINLWGIQLSGNTMYAVQDNSANLAVYNSFFSKAPGNISADQVIEIESMIRTHGLQYDADADLMALTDVAEASSSTDGAIVIVNDFSTVIDDNVISDGEQFRIEGLNSTLGNPVDIAIDLINNLVIVAERANEGGKVLSFELPVATGDATPSSSISFSGASAIYLNGSTAAYEINSVGDIFISSNNGSNIGQADINEDFTLDISTFQSSIDGDGIYYDSASDVVYQINRTDNVVNAYSKVKENLLVGIEPELTATSTADFTNAREMAISGDRLVVAQDANDGNGQENKLYVYQFSPTDITLKKVYDVTINLWGIHADINTLYAVVDNSNELAVFENFFENLSGAISPTQTISVENLIRTHGLTYDADTDVMLLTDVGEASSDTDGAVIVVNNFSSASLDDNINTSEQIRISGANTALGNPVDIALNKELGAMYVAERANGGGRILGYYLDSSGGDLVPFYNELFAGASAIFIEDVVRAEDPTTSTEDLTVVADVEVIVYPNPTADYITVQLEESTLNNPVRMDIVTVDGKSILSRKLISQKTNIDLSQCQSGIYLIKISSGNQSSESKVLKM